MKILNTIGKYLDQPYIVSRFSNAVPLVIAVTASGIVLNDTYKTHPRKRKKRLIQNGLTMFGAVASSLLAPKITAKLFKTAPKIVGIKELERQNTNLINNLKRERKLKNPASFLIPDFL